MLITVGVFKEFNMGLHSTGLLIGMMSGNFSKTEEKEVVIREI